MRMRIGLTTLLAAALTWAPTLSAQNPPPKPPEKEQPKPQQKKPKKVWTNEDLGEVRKPWDEHADKKAAEAEAAKAAEAQKAAEEQAPGTAAVDPATGKPFLDPNSPESLEKQLKSWEDELKRTEEMAEEARKEVVQYAGVDEDRWESAKLQVEIYEENITELQKKIEEVRTQLADAKKKGSSGAKQAAPAPPAPP